MGGHTAFTTALNWVSVYGCWISLFLEYTDRRSTTKDNQGALRAGFHFDRDFLKMVLESINRFGLSTKEGNFQE
jgi:hypothetical protein